jgi:glycosyltransferase involved in cell wall biosynthesis
VSRSAEPGLPSVLLVVEQLRRPVPGGIGTYVRGLLSGLAEVERTRGESIPLTLFASRVVSDPLEGHARPVRTVPVPSRLLSRAWDRGLLRAPRGFSVVHGTSFATPARARGDRAALVVTVHDLAWRAYPEATTRRGRRWHEAALRRALARADAFVAPSALVREELVAAGAPADAVQVIPEGCDHLPPPDRAGAAAVLKASGVDGPYLLTVSTLEPRKNLRRLLDAYRSARTFALDDVKLVVAGPLGWGDGAPIAGPTDGVVPIGHVEGAVLSGLYAGAAAFVYVPLAEGFGLPPLEAMAASVPVMTSTSVPSITEAPGDPPALLVDPTDTEAIARGLTRLVTDTSLAGSLAARGEAFARSRPWRKTAAAHLELWRHLR